MANKLYSVKQNNYRYFTPGL